MRKTGFSRNFCLLLKVGVLLAFCSFTILFIYHHQHHGNKIEYDHDYLDKQVDGVIRHPILIWWTPFSGGSGRIADCGYEKCFVTANRKYKNHKLAHGYMFYGSDFKAADLPLPRKLADEWGLFHEESPKNNYYFSHEEVMTLFNYTATFKRESDMPLTTQHLENIEYLEDTTYFVSVSKKNLLQKREGLAPIIYTQSDCNPPSDRDHLVKLLMKYIKIDSYGTCLHNKDLPLGLIDPISGMAHKDFLKITAKYKFSLAFENGICDDYITEKFWRPLHVGSVPIVLGSPKIKDFYPDTPSVINVDDFKTVEELAKFIKHLDSDDEAYEKYLKWKTAGVDNLGIVRTLHQREWDVNSEDSKNRNFVDSFECMMCKSAHLSVDNKEQKLITEPRIAQVSHYGCPKPKKFKDDGTLERVYDDSWDLEWVSHKYKAIALRRYVLANDTKYTEEDLYDEYYKHLKSKP